MNYQDVPLPPAPSTPEDAFSEIELPTNFNDVTLEDEETIRKNQERIMREKLEQAQRDAIAKREKEMKKVWVDVKQRTSLDIWTEMKANAFGAVYSQH